jgi:hypothetical protein
MFGDVIGWWRSLRMISGWAVHRNSQVLGVKNSMNAVVALQVIRAPHLAVLLVLVAVVFRKLLPDSVRGKLKGNLMVAVREGVVKVKVLLQDARSRRSHGQPRVRVAVHKLCKALAGDGEPVAVPPQSDIARICSNTPREKTVDAAGLSK